MLNSHESHSPEEHTLLVNLKQPVTQDTRHGSMPWGAGRG
jgi:hypothetical protein